MDEDKLSFGMTWINLFFTVPSLYILILFFFLVEVYFCLSECLSVYLSVLQFACLFVIVVVVAKVYVLNN